MYNFRGVYVQPPSLLFPNSCLWQLGWTAAQRPLRQLLWSVGQAPGDESTGAQAALPFCTVLTSATGIWFFFDLIFVQPTKNHNDNNFLTVIFWPLLVCWGSTFLPGNSGHTVLTWKLRLMTGHEPDSLGCSGSRHTIAFWNRSFPNVCLSNLKFDQRRSP